MHTITKAFADAVLNNETQTYFRLHVKLPDEKVGITAWYTKAEIGNVRQEVERQPGHTVFKVEESTF